MYPPDGLLTHEGTKHEVEYDPRFATTPFIPGDCLDDFPTVDLCLVTETEEPNMNTSEDEPSSGLNGRLRPRKSNVPSPQGKTKPESKTTLDKPKRTSTPSKVSPNKQDDLASKSDFSHTSQFLCPFCDRKFASRQTVSKHTRRMHYTAPKQDTFINCLFCNHTDADSNIIRHMVDSHPNQYFACLDCHTRFPSTSELAEHKLNVCEKQKDTYRTKPRQKIARGTKKAKKPINITRKTNFAQHGKEFQEGHGFNGIVISCELKPPQDHDGADIEDNITTNLILPSSKNLGGNAVLEKNAVIVLDDIQWNKRIPPNFAFHNTDPDQILSRLGVVHRSPRTGESTKKDWFKALDDATQKFERCFDTKFYSKVASNVQENLTKFLDGSFNFNPDPDSQIKTRKSKNNVVINTAEGFPILLASEQYSRSVFDGYMPRAIAPKHKWKWDNLENDRSLMTAAEILKRDSHTNNCIITLVSSLDIWTQLSMRRKFEDKFNVQPVEKKTEKQNIISKELKEILESREIPPSSQIVKKCATKPAPRHSDTAFPALLGLVPASPTYEARPAVLSGEWVRPRCLVCCACGEQSTDSKGLTAHIATRHPNASVQCYEIVGEPLLNADILKHLYVPPSQVCNRTRPPRGFRECTKCNKSVTLDDLHQHMLECAGDTPAVRRRQARQRPFGVRRRRPRMPDNTIRKKMRKDIRSRQRRQKPRIGPRPRIRTEVGDAETIRKMLADLPAKRHRVLVNPLNMMQRPRRKLDMQRSKLILRKRSTEEMKNRKQLMIKKGMSDEKDGSATSDDPNKNMSSLEDDEDNKPLKPKIKTTTSKTLRRREPLKRQTIVLSTAKRKSLRAAKRKVESADKIIDAAIGTDIQDNSLEKPQRLDIKKAAYNTREHAANRGASNNRDDQRPGCSGTNGTANNFSAPTPSVPLKHSIARLTANSETHDKSVQFHHSFLVQQECNNTNQHVPTGQRTLFENEAVVSKLDKPPLNFCQRGFLDMSLQKNKANKPRKGLNDCIAMLKNKLVDPEPCPATGYVSVQCGSDEPIDDELPTVAEPTIIEDLSVEERSQPLDSTVLKPQDKVKNFAKIPEDTYQLQEKELETQEKTNLLQYRENTARTVNKNIDSVPQHRQEDAHIIKQNLEGCNEKVNIAPQHGQDAFKNVKQNTESLPSNNKVHLNTQYRQDQTRNVKQSSDSTHSQEKVNLPTHYRQESSRNVKQSSENSNSHEKLNSSHEYRHETSLKQGSEIPQFHEKLNLVPNRHETAQQYKQCPEYLHIPENLSVMPHYRPEVNQTSIQTSESLQHQEPANLMHLRHDAIHKLKQNPEFIRFQENLALIPQYRQEITQKVMQCPEPLHIQEKIYLGPQYRQETTQKYKQNQEVNSFSLHGNTTVHVDCDMYKMNSREVSPNVRSRRDSGHNQVSPNTRSRRDSSHSQVSPQMRSPYDPGPSQVSPHSRSRRDSGHSQVSPQIQTRRDSGHSQASLQITSRRNSGHSQVSPQIRTRRDSGHSQVSPQIQTRRDSGHGQVSPQIHTRRNSGHGSQIRSRHDSGHSSVSPHNPSPHDPSPNQVSPQYRSRHDSGHSQNPSPHDSAHCQVSPQFRSPQDSGHIQVSPQNRSPHDTGHNQASTQFRSRHDSGHSQVSSQIRSRYDFGHSITAETIKEVGKRQSTEVYIESEVIKKDSQEIKPAWQPSLDVFPSKSGPMLPANKHANSYPEAVICRNNPDMIVENNLNAQHLEIYSEGRIREIPTNIPPAHASTIVESIISAPLDLSSKVVSHMNMPQIDSYDNYETLDLSNKKTDRRSTLDVSAEENIIVDLSVKASHPRNSPVSLDLCVKPGTSKSTDDTNADTLDNYPTDLSVRGKETCSSSKSHKSAESSVIIQDLSASKSPHLQHSTLTPHIDNLCAKGLPERTNITHQPKTKFSQEVHDINIDSKDFVGSENKNVLSVTSDNLAPKIGAKQPKVSMIPTLNIEQTFMRDDNEVLEINSSKDKADNSSLLFDKSSIQLPKHTSNHSLVIAQYKTGPNVSEGEAVVEDSVSASTIIPLSASLDLNYSKISATSCEVINPMTICSSVSPLTGAVTIHPMPGRAPVTSISKIESTTPVYTLANACISVTKIESSNATVLTNTLLSIPGSTIASTTPVYTLTGTTISAPNNELVNGPSKSQTHLHTLTHPNETFVGPDSEIRGNFTKSMQKEEIRKDFVEDQDPETAKKIAMLPKELMDILGNMPVDHRNQLLNVLPQYVSTTVANCASYTDTNQTIKDTLAAMPKGMMSPTGKLPSDKISFEQKHSISYKVTATSDHDMSTNKSQLINEDIHSVQIKSRKYSNEETVGKETNVNMTDISKLKVIDGNTSGRDISNIQHRIIDLTQDDNTLPVTTLVEVPRVITIPPQDISTSGDTGVSNQKRNNDKTASLRAVRIKAPSLRQKEKQKFNTDKVEPEASQCVFNAEIQQVEKCNLQNNDQTTIEAQNVVKKLPVDTIEDAIKTPDKISTPTTNTVNDKDESADKAVTKSKSNTSSLPITNYALPNKELKESQTVTKASAEKVSDKKMYNVECKTNVVCDYDDKLKLVNNVDNNNVNDNLLIQENNCANVDEEDSEDDIILAAIVKQKQKSNTTSNKQNIKKKKKEKKTKKHLSKETGDDIKESCHQLSKIDSVDDIIQKSSQMHTEISIHTNSEQELKARLNDSQNINVANDKKQNCESEIKPSNKATNPELVDKKVDVDQNPNVSIQFVKENERNLTNVSEDTRKEDTSSTGLQDKLVAKPLSDLKQLEKSKKKKVKLDVKSCSVEQEKCKEESQLTVACAESNAKTTTIENQRSDPISDNINIQQKQLKDVNELKTEIKKNTKADRSKKYPDEFSNNDSINEIQDIENNIDAPLRRSRRGKSLFLEGNLSALENLNMDNNTIDQKGPLTKKQLIFSKLLLDEEKLTKSLITSSEEVASVTDNIETTIAVPSDVAIKASKIDIADITTAKNKSVKRKKSPQLKRKSKKKKSSDEIKVSDEDILNDQSESDIKINLEKRSEQLAFSVADTALPVEIVEKDEPKEKVSEEIDSSKVDKKSDTSPDIADDEDSSMNVDKKNHLPESDNCNSIQYKPSSILEKRKSGKIPSSVEIDQISKPKKTKFNKNKETELSEEQEAEITTSSNIRETESSATPETIITTCYDVPVAARRTRSKSVVVKSSNAELYDPYNIDLDDMIQRPEPLRKAKTKELKTKRKNSSKLSETQVSDENELKTGEKDIETETVTEVEIEEKLQQKSKLNQSETSPSCSKEKNNAHVSKLKQSDSEKEVNPKKSSDVLAKEEEDTELDNHTKSSEISDFTIKDTVSDSDESSKSDVPLKKYVEGKVKKLAAKGKASISKLDNTDDHNNDQKNNNKHNTSGSKKRKSTPTSSKESVSTDLSNETEKQIRSEQFMESFGFFSERKPRKSNLLATKKISETFHIIANEGEDFYGGKERSSKKSVQTDTKKSTDNIQPSASKKGSKRGRKKKEKEEEEGIKIVFCNVCRKEFRRRDNLLRHQMTLLHVAKLSHVEMNEKSFVIREEPNYLVAYRENIDRFRNIAIKAAAKQKRNSRTRIVLPDLEDIYADIEKVMRNHRKAHPLARDLSTDQVLLLDCCDIFKDSRHCAMYALPGLAALDLPTMPQAPGAYPALRAFPALQAPPALRAFPTLRATPALPVMPSLRATPAIPAVSAPNALAQPSTSSGFVQGAMRSLVPDLDYAKQPAGKNDSKSDDDVDSVTARSILESDEIKSLEHDLILGFKEAAKERNARRAEYYAASSTTTIHPHEISSEVFSRSRCKTQVQQLKLAQDSSGASVSESESNKTKKLPEYKEKMYPDVIEDIDMFEDKFDKIKRKCRSQAAAAKQVQSITEPSPGYKGRKKAEKKKGKKSSKKNYQNTVLTKGALKGFDGIKVSIPTSDINMSAIVPPHECSQKKKRRTSSKKKREKRDSDTSSRYDSDHRFKDNSNSQKKVDVYEFMDNEDAELFEFRPSTLMERFKSFNKDGPSTSKRDALTDEPDNSSESGSDGDDFVYMSDDYVCSDDETENSSLSCELGNVKIDTKKSTTLKRKDVVEKNAVMGKIFKHNAVRTEKKSVKSKETVKPKANLDQLFDSLLEEKPNTSLVNDSFNSPKQEIDSTKQQNCSPKDDFDELEEEHKPIKCSPNASRNSSDESNNQQKNSLRDERNSLDDDLKQVRDEQEALNEAFKQSRDEVNALDVDRKQQNFSPRDSNHVLDERRKQQKCPPNYERSLLEESRRSRKKSPSPDKVNASKSSLSSKNVETDHDLATSKYDLPKRFKYGPSTSKQDIDKYSTSATYDMTSFVNLDGKSPKKNGSSPNKKHDISPKNRISPILVEPSSEIKQIKSKKSSLDTLEAENSADFDEDTGVARHRARRKCTVGKQNVLAETWSSESEPDGLPPRPASAESVVASAGRKKKGRKRDGQQAFGRRAKVTFNKKQDIESRVTSSKWSTPGSSSATSHGVAGSERSGADTSGAGSAHEAFPPPAPSGSGGAGGSGASTSGSAAQSAKPRARATAYYWSSEGDDEQEQQQQQHGWIVGNSHKRLVTMLAHAKGRKRNNDDKRHLVE